MSDHEYEEDDEGEDFDYEYPSEEEEEEGDGEEDWERNVRVKEQHQSPWMDADEHDFRLWSEGNAIRMSIFSAIRQILQCSCPLRILCSKEELYEDKEEKGARIFLEVTDGMTVVYTLSFSSTKSLSVCPPVLRCVSYCGKGTYLFPTLLLPNCLGQFIDYGKVFYTLSRELLRFKSSFSSFIMVSEDSPYYMIQELAYLTQYKTSFIFDLKDSGIVTGVERNRKVKPGDGIGYSVNSLDTSCLKIDDSHQFKLTVLMRKINEKANGRVLDSPLPEIVSFFVAELSVEEITRSSQYAEALFTLIASLQSLFKKSDLFGFESSMIHRLSTFHNVLGDEYGLQHLVLPEGSDRKKSRGSHDGNEKNDIDIDDEVDDVDPVIFIEKTFTRHTLKSGNNTVGKKLLKRMKVEFHTLSTSLPRTIRYMVPEEDFSLGKFLIVGPVDTPYEGGYFLFDLKLPADYPDTCPKVNFLTTGGGSVRFNPNLYNCGKVCLSLLGTWSGEKWDPAVSNINQVLQSICFLIFVEEPYFNEPGYARSPQTLKESEAYNIDKRRSTMRAAYLDHLTHPDPYFGEIIRDMMLASWDKTKLVFEKWISDDKAVANRSCIDEIEAKLMKTPKKSKKK